MTRFIGVATIAFLLVGMSTSIGYAQDPSEDGPKEQVYTPEKEDDGPSEPVYIPKKETTNCSDETECHLGPAHYWALKADYEAKLEKLQDQVEGLKALQKGMDSTNSAKLQVEINRLSEKIAELTEAINAVEMRKLLNDDGAIVYDWSGWFWGMYIKVGGNVLHGSENHTIPIQLGAMVRWIHPSHWGLELSTELGVYQTEDVAPFAASGHIYGLAKWDTWGVVFGPALAYYQSPITGLQGYLLTHFHVGPEVVYEGFFARFVLGPTLYNEALSRFGGLNMQGHIGFCF